MSCPSLECFPLLVQITPPVVDPDNTEKLAHLVVENFLDHPGVNFQAYHAGSHGPAEVVQALPYHARGRSHRSFAF